MNELDEAITAAAKRWRDRSFYEHMKRCEAAWRAGVSLAVAEAVSICRIYQHLPPPWLDEAVAQIVEQKQTPAEAQEYLFNMKHYTRWDAVKELRERKAEFLERGDTRAATWDNIFSAVSEVLADTAFAGGRDAIEKSYKEVERDMREGKAAKYFTPFIRIR